MSTLLGVTEKKVRKWVWAVINKLAAIDSLVSKEISIMYSTDLHNVIHQLSDFCRSYERIGLKGTQI